MKRGAFSPLAKEGLADRLAREIWALIRGGEFRTGDRLPPIREMAQRFGVGHPTIREALKTLETTGVVEIRHGSGVYVTRSEEVLVLPSRGYTGTVSRKLLLDLTRARMPLEVQSACDAVHNATAEDLAELRRLLDVAAAHLDDDEVLSPTNIAFHRRIALASGNAVITQLLDVLGDLFQAEQRLILGIFGSRARDHREHVGILEALERRDEALATRRMKRHLEGVYEAIRRWDPEQHPVR
jgi:GntR family transcriptional repressor for pyruvate dehydrogenase complex